MERKSGVLMHISSLWGDYSSGSFGRGAFEMVDFLSSCGFSYWQVLPFGLPDDFNSPYSSLSAFSVNPYFIDLEDLYFSKLITREELELSKQHSPYRCEFSRLKNERFELLKKAASRYDKLDEAKEFLSKYPHTEKFCHFMAIRYNNNDKPFWEWDNDTEDESILNTWIFICYIFFKQWFKVKSYANSKNIKIIGDIPIYVAQNSSDVWEDPSQFLVNEQRRPLCVAGVPPDYFSKEGQLWGNPIYNWEKMKSENYKWWKDRMNFTQDFFDCIRFDHFRGFLQYYTCPPDAKNAVNGAWHKGPGLEFIEEVKKICTKTSIIAEDLGELSKDVDKFVIDSGFPGMKVFQFANPDEKDNVHLPHNYPNNCVAYTGTHDNNTLLGHIWEMDSGLRQKYLNYCGYFGNNWDSKEAYYSVIRTLLESVADTVIFPLQDLLLYGADTRMNSPGTVNSNWEWRCTKDQLSSIDTSYMKYLNTLYSR